jgi:hypothetical protein
VTRHGSRRIERQSASDCKFLVQTILTGLHGAARLQPPITGRLANLRGRESQEVWMSLAVGLGRTYFVDNPLQQNVRLGMGFNTLTGETTTLAVVDQDPHVDPAGGGQTVRYTLTICETSDQLDQALSISASASYTALFGTVEGRVDFARSFSEHRYYLYVVVRCRVENSVSFVTAPAPSDALAKLVGQDSTIDFEAFRNQFGDSYVKSVQTGGEFIGVLRWQTTTQTEQTKISGEVKGQFTSGSFNVDTAARIAKLHTSSDYQVYLYRNGAHGPLAAANDMVDAALRFPSDVDPATGHPVVYQFGTGDYATFLPATLPSVDHRRAALEEYASYAGRLNIVRNDVTEVVFHPENKLKWGHSITAAKDRIAAAVSAIVRAPYNGPDDPAAIDSAVTATIEGLEYNLTQPIQRTDVVPPGQWVDLTWEAPKYVDTWVRAVTFYVDGDKIRGIHWETSDGVSCTHGDTSRYPYTWTFEARWVLKACSIFWTGYGYNTPLGISMDLDQFPGSGGFAPPVRGGALVNLDAQVRGRRLSGFCGALNPDNFMQSLGLYTSAVPRDLPL